MFIVPFSRRVVARPQSFDHLFEDAFDRFFATPYTAGTAWSDDRAPARRPAVDVTESDASYVITLDVPGVRKEDVQVSVEGRRVSIVAETRSATDDAPAGGAAEATGGTEADVSKEAAKAAAARTLVRERSYARYARSFTLPADIEQGTAQARLENGVLTVTLPKRARQAGRATDRLARKHSWP
jgi:HSP20 family protein